MREVLPDQLSSQYRLLFFSAVIFVTGTITALAASVLN